MWLGDGSDLVKNKSLSKGVRAQGRTKLTQVLCCDVYTCALEALFCKFGGNQASQVTMSYRGWGGSQTEDQWTAALRRSDIFPPADVLSAYQACVSSPLIMLIKCSMPLAYITMAKGSSCVVPSCERIWLPPRKSLEWERYVFVSIGTKDESVFQCSFRVE